MLVNAVLFDSILRIENLGFWSYFDFGDLTAMRDFCVFMPDFLISILDFKGSILIIDFKTSFSEDFIFKVSIF